MVDWTAWFSAVFQETFWGSFTIVRTLVVVIVPMMIVLQIMLDYHWLEKLSQKTKYISGFLGITKHALVPLLIGFFSGISYGAGAILFAQEKYKLPKEDIFLMMCFVTVCHGVIEVFIIFWVIGVNPVGLTVARLALAVIMTLFFKRWIRLKRPLPGLRE